MKTGLQQLEGSLARQLNLNEKIIYARGWNDAIRSAALIASNYVGQDAPQYIAKQISELDKSMKACDD